MGAAAVAPPTNVMGLGEPPRPAAREPAFSIPVANLADHPARRLPGQTAESQHSPGSVLDHGLHPGVAEETSHAVRMDGRTPFDLASTGSVVEPRELGVDHDRGPVWIGCVGGPARAHSHQGVGSARVREGSVCLPGHRWDMLGHPFDRSSDDGSLRRRQLGLQTEPPTLIRPPPRE
jgi:hypothetical protein